MDATFDSDEVNDYSEKGVGQILVDGAPDQSACYSNRYDNYTYCDNGGENDAWTVDDESNDNDCIADVFATFDWADVMNTAFGNPDVQDNGRFTEVYLKATVETWTHFRDYEDPTYRGQMTGNQEFQNNGVDDETMTNRNGEYTGDGGWRGVGDDGHSGNFGPIIMDDERYTLYQIPFTLRFPRTVQVRTSFKAASPITVLTGVLAQDVISLDLNPTAGVFATLEAVLTTQVQYPYSIRTPSEDGGDTAMAVYVGAAVGASESHAAGIEFIEWVDGAACGGDQIGDMCEQTFKVRITPGANTCTVAGKYTFEFWMTCTNGGERGADGCALDDLVDSEAVEQRRASNAYMTQTIDIQHQPFCPVVVDEVRVVGDFHVYHDEAFGELIGENYEVFTNDILFYEASYRTSSAEALENEDNSFESNDDSNVVGDDKLIDFVRATKIYMDVTIGKKLNGDPTDGWNADDFDDNFDFTGLDTGAMPSGNALGATRIPGSDITGADSDELSVSQEANGAFYNIELCSVDTLSAANIADSAALFDDENILQDCFTARNGIATNFLDFNKVMESKSDDNTIDENEVAFSMRMDERIIPLKKQTDNSFVTVTVEAEVYYKGNRQPTRRLLQADVNRDRNQQHSMSTSYAVYPRGDLKKCNVAAEQEEGHLQMSLTFNNADDMPSTAVSLDWAAGLSHQLESYLGVQGVVKVAELSQCNEEHKCQTIYVESRAPRRRLDNAAYLKVDLKIESSKAVAAGLSLNKLQDHIINRRSEIHLKVQAFRKAEVTAMEVVGCGVPHEPSLPVNPRDAPKAPITSQEVAAELELESESSAAAVSTLVATLVGLWALRL